MKIEKLQDKLVYSEENFTKRIIFNEAKVLNFVLNLKPGQDIPPHQHEESDLIINVLTGGAELTVDGKVYPIVKGDVIYCQGKEMFSLKNKTNNDFSCFCILAPRPGLDIYAKEI